MTGRSRRYAMKKIPVMPSFLEAVLYAFLLGVEFVPVIT
jgi:hypothetical protein